MEISSCKTGEHGPWESNVRLDARLVFPQIASMLFGMTSDPGAGRRDRLDNSGCVLMVLEDCRCGLYIEESTSETCRISGRPWKFWPRLKFHLSRRILNQRDLM